MRAKSQKGSIALFVFIAVTFYAGFLLLMYANNLNKVQTIAERADFMKAIYGEDVNNTDSVYKRYIETITSSAEDSFVLELTDTIKGKANDYKIYGNGTLYSLPEEYQEVEYIESTGTQYIDTGIYGKSTIKIDITLANNNTSTSTHFLGSREGFKKNAIGLSKQYDVDAKTTRFAYENNIYEINDSENIINTQDKNNYVFDSKNAYINNNLISNFNTNEFSTSLNIYIFTCNDNGKVHAQMGSITLYHCKIYDENKIVRNFIPCYRKSDEVLGLYDTVNGVFYTNSGSGEFKSGAEITGNSATHNLPSEYQESEYIESTGTQYIDTGVTCNENLKIDVQYYASSYTADRNYIFGVYGGSDSYRVQYSHASTIFAGFGDMYQRDIESPKEDKIYKLIMDNGKFTLDGEEIYNATSAGGKYSDSNTANMFLFAVNANGEIEHLSNSRIYKCKIYIGDTLIRNMVPCYRISDNIPGLYDTVNERFYTNSGTGTFLTGDNADTTVVPTYVGDKITNSTDANYGKYIIPIKISNSNGESQIINIYLEKTLSEGEYLDYKNRIIIRNDGTQENIELPAMPLYKGYTKIEVLTQNVPTKIEVEYNIKKKSNSILPSRYQEVEYLESTGTQYIDTGIGGTSSTQNIKMTLDFQATEYVNNTWICGTNISFECGFFNGFFTQGGFSYSQTSDYLARTTATGSGTTSARKVMLFARDFNGSTAEYRPAKVKIYSAKIYLDNELVRDFIPCYRISDTVPGLYDTVNDKFYTNIGTGTFVIGKEVNR